MLVKQCCWDSVVTVDHYWSDNPAQPYCFRFFPSCRLWSGPWCFLDGVGWKWATGKREGICAHHTSLSSHWQESACSSVGECTCIQSGEERRSERNSGRQRGREEINACQASSLREVLVVQPKRFHCSKHCFISLFVCAWYMCNLHALFLSREHRLDLLFCRPWPQVKFECLLIRHLRAEPI